MYVAVVNIAAQKIKLLNTSTLLWPQVQLLGLPLTHQNNYSLFIMKSDTNFTFQITKTQLFVISNLKSYSYEVPNYINYIYFTFTHSQINKIDGILNIGRGPNGCNI